MCVYLPNIMSNIMVTLYGCIPTRYNGLIMGVYLPDIMVTLYGCIPIPDIMVTYYGCIPNRYNVKYNGHSLWVYTNQI